MEAKSRNVSSPTLVRKTPVELVRSGPMLRLEARSIRRSIAASSACGVRRTQSKNFSVPSRDSAPRLKSCWSISLSSANITTACDLPLTAVTLQHAKSAVPAVAVSLGKRPIITYAQVLIIRFDRRMMGCIWNAKALELDQVREDLQPLQKPCR
jgi:hypothetical protein